MLQFTLNRAATIRLVLRVPAHTTGRPAATALLEGHAGLNRRRIAGRWHGRLAADAGPVQILAQIEPADIWKTVTTIPLTVRRTRRR